MITTSYFAMAKYIKNPLSISNMTPAWYKGNALKMLAPPFQLIEMFKSGYISEKDFTIDFKEQVLAPLNPKDVYSYIVDKFGDDATLLCYEKSGDFCHRRLVAQWFEKGLGFKVPELVIDGDLKKLYKDVKAAKAQALKEVTC